MDKSLRIGIDIDGVLRDFIEGVINRVKVTHPQYTDQITRPNEWSISCFLPFWEEKRCKNYVFQEEVDKVFSEAPIYQDVLDNWKSLRTWARKRKHKLVIVSAQRDRTLHPSLIWLGKHKLEFKELHFTSNKWKVDVDFLIDDKPKNLELFAKQSVSGGMPICFSQPWNTDLHDKYTTITSISEIKEIVDKLTKRGLYSEHNTPKNA